MNKRLRLAVRNAACADCKMHRQADPEEICLTGAGPNGATVGVVTTFALSKDSRLKAELTDALRVHGIKDDRVMWMSAIKCKSFDLNPSKTDLKACKKYMDAELDALPSLDHVITFGGEALYTTTGKSGIMKYRGTLTQRGGTTIFNTISPGMLGRNPGLRGGFDADLLYFSRLVHGTANTDDDPWALPYDDQLTYVTDKGGLRSMLRALKGAWAVAYDIETTGASEFDTDARIVSLSCTVLSDDSGTAESAHVYVVPLYHPESTWRDKWVAVLERIGRLLCRVPRRIAHNAKFDSRWLRQFGIPTMSPTFDTIIAAALLDENRPKGLKPLAQQLLGAEPWAISTKDLLTTPLKEILDYNALDTWHTIRLYLIFRQQLSEQPRVLTFFRSLMMQVVKELINVEQRGVYVDRDTLTTNWAIVQNTLGEIEAELAEHLPDEDEVPDKFKHKKTREVLVNYNASGFLRWWLFDHLGMPILSRGKTKDNGDTGDPSVAEGVMMVLAEQGHVVPRLLLSRVEWNKYHTAFFTPYAAQITDDSRIRTTFKPWGTVTGRMSSGKEDSEKVTGRAQIRGVNLQQVPRSKLVRGVFGAAPGWTFVEADYSQIELRIAAYLARETTMLGLYATGQDIHMAMAQRMTGKPVSAVTSEERKKAKAVNFGFLYGMGWAKFVSTAYLNYGVLVTEEESRAFRKSFFDQFPQLVYWHARQRRLAAKYKRVETPMGRVRHLPDIDSLNDEVRSESERQAINSPVQAMASDMALLALVLTAQGFRRRGIEAYPIGAVHDAVNFEVRNDHLAAALPIIKHTMENLPLERMFGCVVDVPIIADLKVGTHWGGATEVPPALLTQPAELAVWLKEIRG